METITLSLVAHTNVGKTTLARTLLRRDVGQVLDQAHVTLVTEIHDVIATEGARLVLEDTPGFGDSARLRRRLGSEGNPIGWFLHQVWDRMRDKPLWCSQEAVRSVRERADVVLYLVNASESPEDAGYVQPEMEILAWVGRPVLLLLNQVGPGADPAGERAREDAWRAFATRWPLVRGVHSLDAFSRCWVEEPALFERLAALVPTAKAAPMRALADAFAGRALATFHASMERLAAHVARAATDRVPLPRRASGTEKRRAMEGLGERLEASTRATMADLLRLHGLDGTSAAKIEEEMKDFAVRGQEQLSVRKGAVWGGLASGALSGLAADLATGGLSFGGGAVIGAILGALGGAGLAKGFARVGGFGDPAVSWSEDALARLVRDAVARYLAVAHFGRGRGGFQDVELPPAWAVRIHEALVPHAATLDGAFKIGTRQGAGAEPAIRAQAAGALLDATRRVLGDLYPSAAPLLHRPAAASA